MLDFKYFSSEGNAFWEATQTLESNELMREFHGLDTERMIDVVWTVQRMLQKDHKKDGRVNAATIRDEKVRWSDEKRLPSKETVERYFQIGGTLHKSKKGKLILEQIRVRYGHGTVFDEPSKLLLLVSQFHVDWLSI